MTLFLSLLPYPPLFGTLVVQRSLDDLDPNKEIYVIPVHNQEEEEGSIIF